MKKPDFSDSRFQVKFHKLGWKFWAANAVVVTILFFAARSVWEEVSILYLVYVSLYANFASDFTGQSSAEASKQTEGGTMEKKQ